MLSRVAERIYWTARYLERVENTARLVKVYTLLLLDLPTDVELSWYNLVALNQTENQFLDRYKNRDERNIIKFMLADQDNPSAMLECLKMVRENVRTTRDVMPPEMWETVNELYIYVEDNIQQGINRTNRHEYLDTVAQECQKIHGLVDSAMRKDEAWQFFKLGCNIERADMTTRILESGSTMLINCNETSRNKLSPIVWGNILQSLSARHSYQRTVRTAVKSKDSVQFMINDPYFPRTIRFCMKQVYQGIIDLPRNEQALKTMQSLIRKELNTINVEDLGEAFVDWLGSIQQQIADLHDMFCSTWFRWD